MINFRTPEEPGPTPIADWVVIRLYRLFTRARRWLANRLVKYADGSGRE